MVLLQHTMKKDGHRNLSRRERQIMDILYQRGRASAGEIHEALPDPPTYSAVRAKLRVLEEKGHVRHEAEALHYVYLPIVARDTARRSALRHMVSTFFGGSIEQTVAALLDLSAANLPKADLERISQLIEDARQDAGKEGAAR
jgi:BlaI family transcriptional regulator, penicillinase repressor